MYEVPREYYFRIHHVRPRFKGDIENVLIFMAQSINSIGSEDNTVFADRMNAAIRTYPGNGNLALKTIKNWRTEISALFGFFEKRESVTYASRRAIELADRQDLVEFFKKYLYTFQYPGAHIKPDRILEQIEKGIHFKPAQYILKLLKYAQQNFGSIVGLSKAEACHCIFNDLRVTRDNEGAEATWRRIVDNRLSNEEYDQSGDVTRYAGDILDYMVKANLLKCIGNRYYLNPLESPAIAMFCSSNDWFDAYDNMIALKSANIEEIKIYTDLWFKYVNRDFGKINFATNAIKYVARNEQELALLEEQAEVIAREENLNGDNTLAIGDTGEGLIHMHEYARIVNGNRPDLVHLIKKIPNQFAVGYDFNSVELDELKRYIEVKTTISCDQLRFNTIHLTRNEWNTARSVRDRYFIYRLMLSSENRKLFLLQNPVELFDNGLIDVSFSSNGVDISFNPDSIGVYEELLSWVS